MADRAGDGEDPSGDLQMSIEGVATRSLPDGSLEVTIRSSRGEIQALLHTCEGESGAAIFVGGALGGLDGPADGLYPRLANALSSPERPRGLTALRLHYRQPGEFQECVLDVLGALSFLKGIGAQRVGLVGHSFGAAVVIKAGELSDLVAGVASLSPQLFGTRTVERLAPKPLLLVHGTKDKILDCAASKDIHKRAREPKRLVLYEGAGHGLRECASELDELLGRWLGEIVGASS